MTLKKEPISELWKPFSFTQSSAKLSFVKSKLMQGYSIVIEPVYADHSTGYLARVYDPSIWRANDIMELYLDEGAVEMHELHGFSVFALGMENRETLLIDETLSAGFAVSLLVDQAENTVVGDRK